MLDITLPDGTPLNESTIATTEAIPLQFRLVADNLDNCQVEFEVHQDGKSLFTKTFGNGIIGKLSGSILKGVIALEEVTAIAPGSPCSYEFRVMRSLGPFGVRSEPEVMGEGVFSRLKPKAEKSSAIQKKEDAAPANVDAAKD